MRHRDVCENAEPKLGFGEAFDVPRPVAGKTWIDDQGATRHRRGQGLLSPKRAGKLLSRTDTMVLHVFGGAPHEHLRRDREGLVAAIENYWAGDADPMSTFDLSEFRDDAHRTMVMVIEGC